ncbi:MAG: DUF1963 domain-containing protein [Defluviitaleaceae bacterium]|nr:DUF1963 domain-containing protein [Defluviitaleaceae bacterium]
MPTTLIYLAIIAVIIFLGLRYRRQHRPASPQSLSLQNSPPPQAQLSPKTQVAMEAAIQQFINATQKPSILLTATSSQNTPITASKLGGTPYLPQGFEYPHAKCGKPLKLLAQLNFDTLPKLPNYPATGLLQFYILPNDFYGLNVDDFRNNHVQDTFRVVYHKESTQNQAGNLPDLSYYEDNFPVTGEFLLTGTIESISMSASADNFRDTFKAFCKDYSHLDLFAPYFASENTEDAGEIDDLLMTHLEYEGGTRIGGYPYFTQYDPRAEQMLEKYNLLLLQIDSEYDDENHEYSVAWGDSGVGNFFINAEDLKNCVFDDVLYNWDCF